MKVLQLFQSVPKWIWLLVGSLAIVLPELANFLTQVNGYSPEWLDIATKVVLWIIGFSPIPTNNKN